MTGLELQTRILKRLGDDPSASVTNQYYSASNVMTALNQLQRFFVMQTICLETTSNFAVDGSTFYRMLTFFADWIIPLRVKTVGGLKLKPSRLTDLAALDSSWVDRSGAVSRYSHSGMDLLGIYKQTTTTLTATYARCPVDLVAAAEPEIPQVYHPALISGAIPLLRLKEGGDEWQKTLPLFDEFMKAVSLCRDQVKQRNIANGYDAMPPEIKHYDLSKLFPKKAV